MAVVVWWMAETTTAYPPRLFTANTLQPGMRPLSAVRRTDVRQVWLNAPHYHLHLPIQPCAAHLTLRHISSLPSNKPLYTIPRSPPSPYKPSKLPPDLLSALVSSHRPDTTPPHHTTFIEGLRQLRHILSTFVTGSKQLLRNARHAYTIQQQLRANHSLALNRADHRHLARTRVDVLGGVVIVALFFVPVVGNVVPLLAQLFPRQLPSVFVTSVRRYGLIRVDVKHGLPLLLELQRQINRLQPSQLAETTREVREVKAATLPSLPLATNDPPTPQLLTLADVRHPRQLLAHQALFDLLPLSRFPYTHLYSMLQFHSNLLVLHSFVPASTLVGHLHTYTASILTDDQRLRAEGRGEKLGVVELTEALQERGLYRGLLSAQYAQWIAAQRLREGNSGAKDKGKDGGVVGGGGEADEGVRGLLLGELREWLEMTEGWEAKDAVRHASLLCHAGPIVCSDLYLHGFPALPWKQPVTVDGDVGV